MVIPTSQVIEIEGIITHPPSVGGESGFRNAIAGLDQRPRQHTAIWQQCAQSNELQYIDGQLLVCPWMGLLELTDTKRAVSGSPEADTSAKVP